MYYLSKIMISLLQPFLWIIFLVVLGIFIRNRKWRSITRILALVIFLIFSNSAIYRSALFAWQPEVKPQVHQKKYSAGILLGGMVFSNQKKESYFGTTADRFIQAAKLYHTGTIGNIIIAAGDGSISQTRPKEGWFLRQELVALNIPASQILVETESRNTTENAIGAKQLADSAQLQPPFLLITSAMHMKRALLSFEKNGIRVEPHVANFLVIDRRLSWQHVLIPSIGTLFEWPYFLKELLGYWYLKNLK